MTVPRNAALDRLKKSQAHERYVADRYGAVQHAGSGSGPYRKNDSHTDDELFECKRTDGTSKIVIDVKELQVLGRRADAQGRRPVSHLDIAGDYYVVLRDEDYYDLSRRDADG